MSRASEDIIANEASRHFADDYGTRRTGYRSWDVAGRPAPEELFHYEIIAVVVRNRKLHLSVPDILSVRADASRQLVAGKRSDCRKQAENAFPRVFSGATYLAACNDVGWRSLCGTGFMRRSKISAFRWPAPHACGPRQSLRRRLHTLWTPALSSQRSATAPQPSTKRRKIRAGVAFSPVAQTEAYALSLQHCGPREPISISGVGAH